MYKRQGADRALGGPLSKGFEWATNKVAGAGAGTGTPASAGKGGPPTPEPPGASPQATSKTYDTSDGLLPEDPIDLFKSPQQGPAQVNPAPKPPIAEPVPREASRGEILSKLFGRDLPGELTPLQRAEIRLQQIKAGQYTPPAELSQSHLDYASDVSVNAIFSDTKAATPAQLYLHDTRLRIIQGVRGQVK